ncbi:MAG: hypothetical protein JRI98_02040 [Deltaproteobacteria bacterium]|nr:hypothetical protein [Deltaproteobacteria bacterium]MBW2685502.1 hypothetical protein [Deltaproteobacteria bacterium]
MELLAGALLERPPGPKYTSELRFAELAPQAPLPKPGTLAKWRQKLPDGFELALRAPDASWQSPAGPLRPSRELDAGLAWLGEAADALQASMIVVSTSAAVTTGARDRERLRDYFGRIPRTEGGLIAWRPTGLWEPEAVQTMASALSLVGGFDAVDDPAPEAEVLYASLLAEGLRRSFSHALLLDVLDKLQSSGAARAFVTIESRQSFREARLLQALSEGRE